MNMFLFQYFMRKCDKYNIGMKIRQEMRVLQGECR